MSDRRFQAVIQAVHTALHALASPASPDNIIEATTRLFADGMTGVLQGVLAQMVWRDDAAALADLPALSLTLLVISRDVQTLDDDPAGPAQPRAGRLFEAAVLLSRVAEGYSAYVLCEVAYEMCHAEGLPAPAIARLQLELAARDSEEWHASAWRCAIEQCRDALARGSNWLEAIDAFELAMMLPVARQQLQGQLVDDLRLVLQNADATPLRVLKAALPFQAPKGIFKEDYVLKLAVALLRARGTDVALAEFKGDEARASLYELGATMVQIHVDDERAALRPASRFSPEMSWTDHSLAHAQLVDAVPLQRSLIVDIDRSADTLVELLHEVTHAFTLLGPLGWARTAYRAATQYAEMMLIDLQGGTRAGRSLDELEATPPLAAITAVNGLSAGLCDVQFAAQYRSKVLQAVWTPWLEGLAVYAELLCDPVEDETQMFAPLLAIRSLVDPVYSRRSDESEDEAKRRYWGELHAQFEAFCSGAIKRTSRLRHLGYLKSRSTPGVYLLGYLLVRSIISRWELSLGTRLPPAIAIRLLLDATRNGSWDALPPVDADLDDFEPQCQARLSRFVAMVAALPASFLRDYFRPLEDGQAHRRYSWAGGVPVPIDLSQPDAEAGTPLLAAHLQARAAAVRIAVRGPHFESMLAEDYFVEAETLHGPSVEALFDRLHAQSSLVAVGRCETRLVILDEARARVAFCPRTFAGLLGSEDANDLAVARYSIRVVELPGGRAGLQALRTAVRQRGSARVRCTRLVDMVGLAGTPLEMANTSYVYFGLGDWRLISTNDTMRSIGPGFDRFENLARLRVEPPVLMQDEHLSLANAAWLVGRANDAIAALPSARLLAGFDAEACALRSATQSGAQALACDEAALSAAVADLIADTSRHGAIADFLSSHGKLARDKALSTDLGPLAFDISAPSGIRPHPVERPAP